MQFKNTTDYSDTFIRQMLAWCIRQAEVPKSNYYRGTLRRATFTRCSRSYRGRAGGGCILVRIGDPSHFPVNVAWRHAYRAQGMTEWLLDRDAVFVHITAHELAHIRLGRIRQAANNEANADSVARGVTMTFLANRDALMAAWNDSPAPAEPKTTTKTSVQERRAIKAQAALGRWERKLALAKTKVSAYRRRVGYYEKVAATRGA